MNSSGGNVLWVRCRYQWKDSSMNVASAAQERGDIGAISAMITSITASTHPRPPISAADVHISRPRNVRNLVSYIAIAKWKTSSRIRRVTEEFEEDSDRFRFTSETVERLAPNFNVTELYKSRENLYIIRRIARIVNLSCSILLQFYFLTLNVHCKISRCCRTESRKRLPNKRWLTMTNISGHVTSVTFSTTPSQDFQSIERGQLQFHCNPLTAPHRADSIRATEVKGDEVLPHGKALEDRTIGRPTSNSIVSDDFFPLSSIILT
ncbi:hypothetical protein ALC53_08942 [Atta colombica]|uniref:Uncharacterized protein n=1 Tax=Atta colombica TaxID=520822 RepID=A0A151I2L9_9HYME|nr:hypothetical protein ALC53_08942 [Atta colombica]